jgi:hypothetical protein
MEIAVLNPTARDIEALACESHGRRDQQRGKRGWIKGLMIPSRRIPSYRSFHTQSAFWWRGDYCGPPAKREAPARARQIEL